MARSLANLQSNSVRIAKSSLRPQSWKMAGSTPAASIFDKEAHIDASKKEWYRKQRVYKEMCYAKSKLPPMSIEPFPFERQRLPFKMTAEDRALRHQWLRDQHLTSSEPRHIPELRPRNFFRRMFGLPWDVVTKGVISVAVSLFNFFKLVFVVVVRMYRPIVTGP